MQAIMELDIKFKNPYPANALSNLYPHPFTMDGVWCASMEGFLQSLKFIDKKKQITICAMSGLEAQRAGQGQNWKASQELHWLGTSYGRETTKYQQLLDKAYIKMAGNLSFQKALFASGSETLVHSIGKSDPKDTVLTERELCDRLTALRQALRNPVYRVLIGWGLTRSI